METDFISNAAPGGPEILRDTPDAKWRLLELILRTRSSAGESTLKAPKEIILVGDTFSRELLAAARILAEVYKVEIRLAHILNGEEAQHTRQPSGSAVQSLNQRYRISAETKLVEAFFAESSGSRVRKFYQGSPVRWSARARRDFVYIRQFGRFTSDFAFWRKRLSAPDSVRLSTGENRIQFRLHSAEDYEHFKAALEELQTVKWAGSAANRGEDPDK